MAFIPSDRSHMNEPRLSSDHHASFPPPARNALPLAQLNKQAVALARAGDHVGAVAALTGLLEEARGRNVTHSEMYT